MADENDGGGGPRRSDEFLAGRDLATGRIGRGSQKQIFITKFLSLEPGLERLGNAM